MSTQDYDPGDYSQSEINRGQRKINYQLYKVDDEILDALKTLIQTISSEPTLKKIDFGSVLAMINDASERSEKIADIKPPGCDPTLP